MKETANPDKLPLSVRSPYQSQPPLARGWTEQTAHHLHGQHQ